MTSAKLKVCVDTPALFIRPRTNTDWRYMKRLEKLSNYIPVEFSYPFDVVDIIDESLDYARDVAARRLFSSRPKDRASRYQRVVGKRLISKMQGDVIIAHRRRFPVNCGPTPVIWQHAVHEPAMQIAAGATPEQISAQYEAQEVGYRMAARVQVSTQAEAARHAHQFPDIADRFVGVPFFLPGLSAASVSDIREKHAADETVRVLFVGRQSRKKGLDILLSAVRLLSDSERRRLELDVVSNFSDGAVNLAGGLNVGAHTEVSSTLLFDLMRRAHVFAMPCRFESYGLVYIEAMSRGAAVLAPNWEVQREICDYGRAGVNCDVTPEAVRDALRALCFERKARVELAEAALARFDTHYCPRAVARSYLAMFESAAR